MTSVSTVERAATLPAIVVREEGHLEEAEEEEEDVEEAEEDQEVDQEVDQVRELYAQILVLLIIINNSDEVVISIILWM